MNEGRWYYDRARMLVGIDYDESGDSQNQQSDLWHPSRDHIRPPAPFSSGC